MWFLYATSPQEIYLRILSILIILFLVIPIHEFAHAFIAYKLGDPTAKLAGRMTINPISSIDWRGAIFIVLFGIGWGKPVLVDSRNFKHPKAGMALTSLAGPAINFIAAFLGALIFNLILQFCGMSMSSDMLNAIYAFFYYFITLNVGICLFNLIPIPPLDGSKILAAFLPDKAVYHYYRYQNVFMIIILILCFMGVFGRFLGTGQAYITNWMLTVTAFY